MGDVKTQLKEQLERPEGYRKPLSKHTSIIFQSGVATDVADAKDAKDPSALVVPTNEKCEMGAGLDTKVNSDGGDEFYAKRCKLSKEKNGKVLKVSETLVFESMGKLKSDIIIFVHTPEFWEDANATTAEAQALYEKQKKELTDAYFNVFNTAKEQNITRVTCPPFSVGTHSGWGDEVRNTIIRLALDIIHDYFVKNPDTCIKHVRFVVYKEKKEEVEMLASALIDRYGIGNDI